MDQREVCNGREPGGACAKLRQIKVLICQEQGQTLDPEIFSSRFSY